MRFDRRRIKRESVSLAAFLAVEVPADETIYSVEEALYDE